MSGAIETEFLATEDGQELILRRIDVAHTRRVLWARLLLDEFRALAARAERDRALLTRQA